MREHRSLDNRGHCRCCVLFVRLPPLCGRHQILRVKPLPHPLCQCPTPCFNAPPSVSMSHPLCQCPTSCVNAPPHVSMPHPLCVNAPPHVLMPHPMCQCPTPCVNAPPRVSMPHPMCQCPTLCFTCSALSLSPPPVASSRPTMEYALAVCGIHMRHQRSSLLAGME